MPRQLETATLDGMARFLAGEWFRPARRSRSTEGLYRGGQEFVLQELYNYTYKDEHDYLVAAVRKQLGSDALKDFNDAAAQRFAPRDTKLFAQLLADTLAIDTDGQHIAGKVGSVEVGARLIGAHTIEVEHPGSIQMRKRYGLDKGHRQTHLKSVPLYWPIYAGEGEERIAGSDAVDPLPPGTPGLPLGALNTRISNEAALAACNSVVDLLDEGSGAAVIQGRTGTQPAGPDTAVSGTLLFTCVMSDPAFGNAADANPGATATASAISDDTSADATNTLGYCRCSATNDGSTPLDDHIDGEAGTATADFIFNTLSIVTGGVIQIESFTVTMPESA